MVQSVIYFGDINLYSVEDLDRAFDKWIAMPDSDAQFTDVNGLSAEECTLRKRMAIKMHQCDAVVSFSGYLLHEQNFDLTKDSIIFTEEHIVPFSVINRDSEVNDEEDLPGLVDEQLSRKDKSNILVREDFNRAVAEADDPLLNDIEITATDGTLHRLSEVGLVHM